MIGTDYATALFAMMVVLLGGVLGLWLLSMRRAKRNAWQRLDSGLFDCDHCHHVFLNKESGHLTRCPRCNAICIRRRRRRVAAK